MIPSCSRLFSARVHHNDGTQEDINRKELTDILFMPEWIKLEHDISEVQILLNSKILQNTMVLLDSPGNWDNEFLEDLLINYINDHELHGFIYTVKTDNAGGVHEDMLLNLLRIVMKQQSDKQNGNITSRFDPRAAIFLCNRFDNIEASERDTVKEHIRRQLGKIWPGLSESQVIFFSCKNAKRVLKVDTDYVFDGFQSYLEGVRNLYFYAMDIRIRENYTWIETMLQRSQYHLRTVVKRLDLTERDLRQKLKTTQEKLKTLEKKSDSVISELRHDLEILTQNISKQLEIYLKTPMVKTQLVSCWAEEDLPKAYLGSWAYIKARVEDAFYVRLGQLLDEWIHDNKTIKERDGNEKIEENIDGNGDSGLGRSLHPQEFPDDMTENSSTKLFLSRPLKQTFVRDYINRYKKQPVKYAQHRSRKLLSWLLEGKRKGKMELLTLIKNLLARSYSFIESLKRNVPNFIRVTNMELQRFQKCEEKERQHQSEYQKLLTSFEQLKSSFREYGKDEIRVEEFTKDKEILKKEFDVLKLIQEAEVKTKVCKRQNPQGLWTVYQDGFLCKFEKRAPVTIRVYLPFSGMVHTFHEVAKLSSLNVENIFLANFWGIHHTNAPTPAFIYDGRYQSLGRCLTFLAAGHNEGGAQRMDIMLNVVRALDYLENKNLVHMELTRETITVTDTGEVRLTGACLPRIATFPSEMETISLGNFCYLAPEVLKGECYTSAADILLIRIAFS
ncbi:hypothetical protein CHS0354_009095 [Potamilus streckersoni]|uniref:Protein kinase domain-containing protein n=1 Tax=Potamilus streckersoni TaxID=2493646 RepID=A0AAE0TI37_9BIVA|nr:hypothetical protein CHS0354_009095 [Potamilus streckersoni]